MGRLTHKYGKTVRAQPANLVCLIISNKEKSFMTFPPGHFELETRRRKCRRRDRRRRRHRHFRRRSPVSVTRRQSRLCSGDVGTLKSGAKDRN